MRYLLNAQRIERMRSALSFCDSIVLRSAASRTSQ
jgi:hypothetical protein